MKYALNLFDGSLTHTTGKEPAESKVESQVLQGFVLFCFFGFFLSP